MEFSRDEYIKSFKEGELQVLCSAAWPVVQYMWNKDWFSSTPSAGILDMPSGRDGITIGSFSVETSLKTPAVVSEATAYRADDGFVNVDIHRAIELPLLNPLMPRRTEDSLLSLRITYVPREAEISLPVEGWLPKSVEFVQTFPSRSGIRDIVNVTYNPYVQNGRAMIQRFGRNYYEQGFDFHWKKNELIAGNRGAWLKGIPQEQVFGFVEFSSVQILMEQLDTPHLFANVKNETRFHAEVFHILNPHL